MREMMVALLACSVVLATGFTAADTLDLHVMQNDKIKMEINDYEYGYDQLSYLEGVSTWIPNLFHMKITFWDGGQLWEYNTTTLPNGHSGLVEVQDWSFSGTDPHISAHVVLGDHATTPSFTIEITIRMEGNGRKAIRSDYKISKTAGYPNLSNAKLYLYGDPKIASTLGTDQSAYYAARDLFYVYDTVSSGKPDLYFAFNQPSADETRIPMHYYGHLWSGAYGTQPMRDYMIIGANLPDIATATSGDQVAGWNWDLGTITGSAYFTIYIGLGTSLADLAREVTPIFVDGFEPGNTSLWSAAAP